ncbi:MAG: sulfatase-like hydrolase/transferase [Planctomycetia bacterium]|nr:sulfatase-like hydrolase/transferase [Planctomycetia bacterium]
MQFCIGLCRAASIVATALAITTCAAAEAKQQPTKRPNIVVVLADDLGYGDLGCYGNRTIKTPHLDRFASEGLRLTSCYAGHANCSPSRTALMTGRTPFRAGIHNWIPSGSPMHLRRSETTVATLLRNAGYATCHVGKWHLNGEFNLPGQPQPADHGFDHWFSTQNIALPCHRDPDNFVRNGKPAGELEGFSAQLVVDEAARWLREGRDRDKPFFLYVCFHEPHEPIASDHKYAELYPRTGGPSPFDPKVTTLQAHHGNITQMDHEFGRLMRTLDELGLRDTTFVLFTSDNGPAITRDHPHGSAGPLRANKGHMYEGGIRVPGMIRWPGHTQAGAMSDEPVCGVDLLPTVCAVTGVSPPADRSLDGASLLPIFEGRPIERTRPLYWQFNQAQSKPKVAMRIGDWKILAPLTGPELAPGGDLTDEMMRAIKSAELSGFELYNLRQDIGETTNLAEREPKKLAEMSERLRMMYREVRDESPVWPAWQWPRDESKRIQDLRKRLAEEAKKDGGR